VRQLDWEGCANVRDLGGLPTVDGRETAWAAVVRGDTPDNLTPAGWDALLAHGIRTIVDLRNDDERTTEAARPAEVATVQVALDGVEDGEFWSEWASGPQFGTPLYYRPHLERFPERNDYRLSGDDQAEFLASRGTSSTEVILSTLAGLDVEDYLLGSGVGASELAAVRDRMLTR
jgi:hypothetical protein